MNEQSPSENQDKTFIGNEWVLPTDIKLVERAAAEFNKRLTDAGWEEWLTMPFQEMLVNAIVHGNLGIKEKSETENWQEAALREQEKNPCDKKVRVEINITHEEIKITIKDEGEGFDWMNMLNPKNELLKSSGKGWAFLNPKMDLFDSFEYNEKGNEVTLRKNRK